MGKRKCVIRLSLAAMAMSGIAVIGLMVGTPAAGAATSHSAAAEASSASASPSYGIIYNESDKCLDAESQDYSNNGDPVQLWSCNTNSEQQWYYDSSTGQIKNEDGKCLDANSNDFPSQGDMLQLWTCNTNEEQVWSVVQEADGFYIIYVSSTSPAGFWCMDANSNDYPANGDPLQLWSCNDNPEQAWSAP